MVIQCAHRPFHELYRTEPLYTGAPKNIRFAKSTVNNKFALIYTIFQSKNSKQTEAIEQPNQLKRFGTLAKYNRFNQNLK
jgi:hypothetical protein